MTANQPQLDEFKQQIAESFNRRKNYDAESDFHPKLARRLVEYAGIKPGEKIIDMATGTGLVAIAAGEIVGDGGTVIGIDISAGMLEQAKTKIETAKINNIEIRQTDVETVELPPNSCDKILCCTALPFLRDIPATLRRWYGFIKPGGKIGLCVFSETAFIAGNVLREAAEQYGVSLASWNAATGNRDKCYKLLEDVGFKSLEVFAEQLGNYIDFGEAIKIWLGSLTHPLCLPLQQQDAQKRELIKTEYFGKMEALVTDKGIWNDIETFFLFGFK